MERITLGQDAPAAVDAYVEYKRIVGDDDGGILFTPEEYEQYKKEVLPMRLKNRLFVAWASPNGIDCKLVGPETLCFCNHRYKQHKTDFKEIPRERPILLPCKVHGCRCISYNYVPLNGTQPIRCRCKHFSEDHIEVSPFKCNKCSSCTGFHSPFTCGCGEPTYAHEMIIETKEERTARGRSTGHDTPFAAMGGLTGFNALADGYMRLDKSGIGVSGLSKFAHLPTAEERDMAYFESRYQERLKWERQAKKQKERIKPEGNISQLPNSPKEPKK
ncbi:protein FAM221A isoform X2 [Callorhinchus milii]|uniref:Protein FAM221A n=1 Tax=Callorhinchus milii TaxID=7868 RepID=V9L7U2_CALMI|nr:protein FAM221A isoform X2 [Callorhinchus milii]|eukprot:gi/632937870/ref/XP_007901377.1/ PREDICTED: protein FAM221A isoform X2 [Callorhinchus milii]